ncbi:MAG TPA: type II toxin-antitoxin system VapC family toxin [Candidatus Dormibacteraeota bacterium]|nr:type II toxin-antitoxin system VapC family toxin [Candidatus Dormibacteraeota bacterium]
MSHPAGPYVLDASAVLAVLHEEAGADVVVPLMDGAVMSSVNWSEVVQKAVARRVHFQAPMRREVEAVGVRIVPFGADDAEQSAEVWRLAPRAGLSLGDRACLALARGMGGVAVTAERAWAELSLDVSVKVVR